MTERRALPAGDYAVAVEDQIVATVERKSLVDLVATLTSGKLRYLLADLAAMPRAAVAHHGEDRTGAEIEQQLAAGGPPTRVEPTTAEVRAWAIGAGLDVAAKGRLRPEIWTAHHAATRDAEDQTPLDGA